MKITINDFQTNRFFSFVLTEQDFTFVEDHWENEDRLLLDLQHTELFEGFTTWDSLADFHYQFLITNNILKMDELSNEEIHNEDNPTIKSIRFLLTCYVFLMENPCQTVTALTIDRVREEVATYTVTMRSVLSLSPKKPSSPFKVVVDNTKVE